MEKSFVHEKLNTEMFRLKSEEEMTFIRKKQRLTCGDTTGVLDCLSLGIFDCNLDHHIGITLPVF